MALLLSIDRYVHLLSSMQLFGWSFFICFFCHQDIAKRIVDKSKKVVILLAWLSLLSAVMILPIQAAMMGGGASDASNISVWRLVLATEFGLHWCWVILFSCLCAIMVHARHILYFPWLLLLAASLQIASGALVGHTLMNSGWFGIAHQFISIVHAISSSWWFGCLLPLMMTVKIAKKGENQHIALVALKKYSRYGHVFVALIIISGLLEIPMILGSIIPKAINTYVGLLLVKILLVTAMVLLAIYNRYWVVRKCQTEPKRFLHICYSEFLLAILVIGLVAVFVDFSPT